MSTLIETFQHNGFAVEIHHDEDCGSPREYENLCHMVCAHDRYKLGDEQRSEGETVGELRTRVPGILAVLPLYLYDHSGISISTGDFGDRWDSGQVGWAYVTEESAEEMGCVGADWSREKLEEGIRGEVAIYDEFLRGNCYGYKIVSPEGDEIDSCWGFVGSLDDVRVEARGAADNELNPYTPGKMGVRCADGAA